MLSFRSALRPASTRPSASTTSRPEHELAHHAVAQHMHARRRWSRSVRQLWPSPRLRGSRGRDGPTAAAACWTFASTTPASAMRESLAASRERMRFIRFSRNQHFACGDLSADKPRVAALRRDRRARLGAQGARHQRLRRCSRASPGTAFARQTRRAIPSNRGRDRRIGGVAFRPKARRKALRKVRS